MRNPFHTVQKPWFLIRFSNVNTKQVMVSTMVSKWCRISSIHSTSPGTKPLGLQIWLVLGPLEFRTLGPKGSSAKCSGDAPGAPAAAARGAAAAVAQEPTAGAEARGDGAEAAPAPGDGKSTGHRAEFDARILGGYAKRPKLGPPARCPF